MVPVAIRTANQNKQDAADGIDGFVIFLDPVECTFQIIDQHSTKDKGNPQAQRVGKQHQHSFNHMCLLGSKHQCRSEEGPTQGVHPMEKITPNRSAEKNPILSVFTER